MSSAVDIQIVSPPNLARIESYLNDYTYREQIEFSANFNKRLMYERKSRQPFLDTQTGVAQNNTQLMNKRNRMPGFKQGQVYTYCSARWRKSRRQYLTKSISNSYTRYCYDRPFQTQKKELVPVDETTVNSDLNGTILDESSSLGIGGDTSDSKDSQNQQQQLKDDLPKEWFYDDIELNDIDPIEEPKSPADDEYDYDPRYGNKKRKKRRPGKRASILPPENKKSKSTGASGTGVGRGRGRRKPRGENTGRGHNKTVSPTIVDSTVEPPSFEMAAAAAAASATGNKISSGDTTNTTTDNDKPYQKYL
ncbi:zinc finger protein ubi-d4 A [Condylostylus longicornis]|uniref:zinc finger protein ubi-d4 A n=1 Tax=Condylostylus longicornis TaxID=2530218 RepID=UPI00244DDB7D|nr:zinc finger protein ubi-d4 A [Condylostylus longicornis]